MINKKRYTIGDACVCWSLGDEIDVGLSNLVLTVYRILSKMKDDGMLEILDLVPSYKALAVHFNPGIDPVKTIIPVVDDIVDRQLDVYRKGDLKSVSGTLHDLPVVYQGEDLERVAGLTGLTIRQVINLHKKPKYIVAMIGFLPYYPYLIGLDPKLTTPRLASPRARIPDGSVAIGGAQTGIYPTQSPGGWNLIGTTDPKRLELIRPGDQIRFSEVDQL